jgi:hypothetical protein
MAQFQAGEPRMVFARYADDPTRRYFLEQGTVSNDVRKLTRDRLECLIPECPDPRLKVVSRAPRARDGFSHFGGSGNHAPESVFHLQAKALLVQWIRGRWPMLDVAEEIATEGRERTADVMVRSANGHQVALEVQYAALTPEAWRARHDSYARLGITDVWLLGHVGANLRQERGIKVSSETDFQLALSPLHEAMVDAGVPLLWINPVDELIATAESVAYEEPRLVATKYGLTSSSTGPRWHVPASSESWRVSMWITRLEDCSISPAGLVVPRLAELQANRARLDAISKAREQENELVEQRSREQAARRELDRRARTETAIKLNQQREQEWQVSTERADLIAAFGSIPDAISVSHWPESGVFAARERWHLMIYRDLIHGRAGKSFTVADAYVSLNRAGIKLHHDAAKRAETVVAYLDALDRLGYVNVKRASDGWTIRVVGVRRDITMPQPAAAPIAAQPHQTPATVSDAPIAVDASAVRPSPVPVSDPPKPTDLMPEYSGALGYVQHYLPGLEPVRLWHRDALDALRAAPVADGPKLREQLGARAHGVTDEMLADVVVRFRARTAN